MKSLTTIFKTTIFRYAMAGGTASLVDVLLFNLLVYKSSIHYIAAIVVSSTISFFLRFFLQKRAFGASSRTDTRTQFVLYTALFAISVGLTAALMYVFVDLVHIQKSIAQIISILLVAIFCFFTYRHVIFPAGRVKSGQIKKLLIITQKVDRDDPVLGFFHKWVEEMSKKFESIIVICLEKGRSELPENVKVLSLGKEERQSRLQYIIHFYWYILSEKKNYDAVFVHMNQQYVVLGACVWKALHKSIYMWRNHVAGSLTTKLAVRLCDKVFCTSEFSYTARYKKAVIMPVGVNTNLFKKELETTKIPKSILFLSRMAPIKKPDMVIEAFSEMKSRGVDFRASFYGDPSPRDVAYYDTLKKKIVENGLSESVALHAGISNSETVSVYNSHEIFVNLTPSGSYDKTIFEAMACETLILASNRSLYGLVHEDFIFKEGDIADLTGKLEKLLTLSVEERLERGKELRATVVESHSLEKLIEKFSKHII